MRRGLTLIETLVALSLLSGILVVAASWTGSTAESLASASARTNRALATEAVFRLISTDIATGDFGHEQTKTRERSRVEDRVEVRDGVLSIRTRDRALGSGEAVHQYRVESGELVRAVLRDGDSTGPERVLMDGVRALDTSFDDKTRILSVAIEFGRDSARVEREVHVP